MRSHSNAGRGDERHHGLHLDFTRCHLVGKVAQGGPRWRNGLGWVYAVGAAEWGGL